MRHLKRSGGEFIGCLNGPRPGYSGKAARVADALVHVVRQHRRRAAWKRFQSMPVEVAEALLADHVEASKPSLPPDLFQGDAGAVWVTPHFDDFVSGIAILARLHRGAGRSVSVMLSDTYAAAEQYYGMLAQHFGVAFIPANLMTAARRLRAGDGVIILADAVLPLPSMRYVPFMGTMIGMMGLAPRLSAMTGSVLQPFHCESVGERRILRVARPLVVEPTASKGADAYLGLTLIARWMEGIIGDDPASWHHWDRAHRQIIPVTDRPALLDAYRTWLETHHAVELHA